LEQACVERWRTRQQPAQFDALQQEIGGAGATGARSGARLAAQRRGAAGALCRGRVAVGVVAGRVDGGGEWATLSAPRCWAGRNRNRRWLQFPGRFTTAGEGELRWQVGWHHLRRAAAQPTLGIGESRALVSDLSRFVFAVGGADSVVPLRFVLRRAKEPVVQSALRARAAELQRLSTVLHPFYRNAGLALADCLAGNPGDYAKLDASVETFEREWADATDLERTSREALDTLATRRR